MLLLIGCDSTSMISGATPSPPEPSVALWQGFTQAWSYNHRLNALGDGVTSAGCDTERCYTELSHTAASGSGSDTATFASGYSVVFGDDVEFRSGTSQCTFDIALGEGQLLTCTQQVHTDIPAGTPVTTLLQGFELHAVGDADKLETLTVRVGAPEVVNDRVAFRVHVGVTLDCDSLECDGVVGKLDQSVRYAATVRWVVVSGDIATVEDTVELDYDWDNASLDDELHIWDFVRSRTLIGDPEFDAATIGIRGIDVELDDDHHMVEWATAARPGRWADGALPVETTTMFKQWNANTWDDTLAYTEPGSARVRLDTVLLEVGGGCVVEGSWEGELFWRANGGPASGAATVYELVEVERPEGCG